MSWQVELKGEIVKDQGTKKKKEKKGQYQGRETENLTSCGEEKLSRRNTDPVEKFSKPKPNQEVAKKVSKIGWNPFKKHSEDSGEGKVQFEGHPIKRKASKQSSEPKKAPPKLKHASSAENLNSTRHVERSHSDPITPYSGSAICSMPAIPTLPLSSFIENERELSNASPQPTTPKRIMAGIRRIKPDIVEKYAAKIANPFENLLSENKENLDLELPEPYILICKIMQRVLSSSVKKLNKYEIEVLKIKICKRVIQKIESREGPLLSVTYNRLSMLREAYAIFYCYKKKKIEQNEKLKEFCKSFESSLELFKSRELNLKEFNHTLEQTSEDPIIHKTILKSWKTGWSEVLKHYENDSTIEKMKILLPEIVDLAQDLRKISLSSSRRPLVGIGQVQAVCSDLVRTHLGGLGMKHSTVFGYNQITLVGPDGEFREIYLDNGSESEIFGDCEQNSKIFRYFKFLITEICRAKIHFKLSEEVINAIASKIEDASRKSEEETLSDWEILAESDFKKFEELAYLMLSTLNGNYLTSFLDSTFEERSAKMDVLVRIISFLTKPQPSHFLDSLIKLVPKTSLEERTETQKKLLLLIMQFMASNMQHTDSKFDSLKIDIQTLIDVIQKKVQDFRNDVKGVRRILSFLEGDKCPIFIMKLLALTASGQRHIVTNHFMSEHKDLFPNEDWHKDGNHFKAKFTEQGNTQLKLIIEATAEGFNITYNRNLDISYTKKRILSLALKNKASFSDYKIYFYPFQLESPTVHNPSDLPFPVLYEALRELIVIMQKEKKESLKRHGSFKKTFEAISDCESAGETYNIISHINIEKEHSEEENPPESGRKHKEKGKDKEKGITNEKK